MIRPNATDWMVPPAPTTEDALTLLRDDHRTIETLLDDCARLASAQTDGVGAADRSGLLARAGARLNACARIELDVFYPALEAGTDADAGALERARAAHSEMQLLLERLAATTARAEFARRLVKLTQALREHAAFEQAQLFPAARALDLDVLSAQLAVLRGGLLGGLSAD